jgi:uncharacterized membrane protein YdjX (TVP38/TMEM64 family)
MPGGTTVKSMSKQGSLTAGGAAWRFAPLVLIAGGLVLCWMLGWHRYVSIAWLADSRDMLRGYVDANYLVSALVFVVFYVVVTALSFPAASMLTIFAGFLFGWLPGAGLAIVGATGGASILFLAARSAFGGFLRDRAGGLAASFSKGFEKDAFAYLLVLRLAPFVPFFLVNIAPALCGVRPKVFVAATAIGILPGALAYSWLGQGLDSVLLAAKAAGRRASIHDLVTPEITIAFAGLALVALLAAIVRRYVASRAP